MRPAVRAVGILSGGIGLTYLLDPWRGRRRRSELREEARHVGVRTRSTYERASRSWSRQLTGLRARLNHLLRPERGAFDDLIKRQARTAIDSITHSGRAVEIRVHNGQVILSGRVHAPEILPILEAVEGIPGVSSVEDQLHLREPLRSPNSPRRRVANVLARQARWWPVVAIVLGATTALRPTPQR